MTDETTTTEAQRKQLAQIKRAEGKHADEEGFVSLLAVKVTDAQADALAEAGAIEIRSDGGPARWVRLTEAARA